MRGVTRETLSDTVMRECTGSEDVAHAWVAGGMAFALQMRITVKRTVKRGDDGEWTYVEPKYASSAACRRAEQIVERIKRAHPEASSTLVIYKYWPGSVFVEVFRGAEQSSSKEDDDD